jgi:hypothetical protein
LREYDITAIPMTTLLILTLINGTLLVLTLLTNYFTFKSKYDKKFKILAPGLVGKHGWPGTNILA